MPRSILQFPLLLLLTLALCVGSCDRPPTPPAPVTATGPRIVALSPAVGVIIRDLGYATFCVGRHGHDVALPASLPVVGTQTEIDYESLLRVNPTHVFTQWGSRDLPPRLVQLAAAQHWTLTDARLLSLTDIRQSIEDIDRSISPAIGGPAQSAAATALLHRMDAAWTRRGNQSEGYPKLGRVLLLASINPPAAFGPGSCHYELLTRLGATPAITAGAAYIELDNEDILKLAPDTIILVHPRPAGSAVLAPQETAALERATLAPISGLTTPAAKAGRMALIDDPLGFIPSSNMIEFADELAAILDSLSARSAAPTSP